MALGFLQKVSPEYVLGKAFLDIKKYGVDGLKPYLTEEAKKKLEIISGGMSLISAFGKIVGSLSDSNEDSDREGSDKEGFGKAVSFLMEKMSEFDFGYKNMVKESDTAKAVLTFEYPDVMEGTFDIRMIKQDKEWKINDLSMPHFDKVSLPVK